MSVRLVRNRGVGNLSGDGTMSMLKTSVSTITDGLVITSYHWATRDCPEITLSVFHGRDNARLDFHLSPEEVVRLRDFLSRHKHEEDISERD